MSYIINKDVKVFGMSSHKHKLPDGNYQICFTEGCVVLDHANNLGRNWDKVDVRRNDLHILIETGLTYAIKTFGMTNPKVSEYIAGKILQDERNTFSEFQ